MKKNLLALLATFLMVGMFSACSSSDDKKETTPTDAPTVAPTDAPTVTPPSDVTAENILPF